MKPSQVSKSIRHLLSKRRAAMVWGPPGCGKSETIEGIANEDKIDLIDFRLAMRDPTDIKGFPMPDQATQTMKFYRDAELPTEGRGILFMDEIVSATPATQACAMQLTLTGRIGDYVLPEGWGIVAAGNRLSDRSVVHRMPSALSDRFIHIDFEPDVDDWATWAFKNSISANTIAFIRFRRDLLNKFDANERSFPTSRSWTIVDQDIIDKGLDADTEFELVKGKVGEGAAAEYMAFVKTIRDMPNIDKILMSPDDVAVPTEKLSVLHALSTALVMRTEKNNFDRVMKYVNRMPTEFQVVYVRDCTRRDDAVCDTKAFQEWVINNSDVMV
jgi:MoxR-like ATPase